MLAPFDAPNTGNCPAMRTHNKAIGQRQVRMGCALGRMVGKQRILCSPLATLAGSAARIARRVTQLRNHCTIEGATVASTPSKDPHKLLPPECHSLDGQPLRGESILRERTAQRTGDVGVSHE